MKSEILECVQHYSNSCTKILKDFAPEYYTVHKVIKVDYTPNRSAHRGGLYSKGPGINLAGNDLLIWKNTQTGIGLFKEYASFADDSVIGNAYITKWEQYVGLIVGHEVSHAVQRYLEYMRKLPRSQPHGNFFKEIYRTVRTELNKEFPDQKELHNQYQKFLRNIWEREKCLITS